MLEQKPLDSALWSAPGRTILGWARIREQMSPELVPDTVRLWADSDRLGADCG